MTGGFLEDIALLLRAGMIQTYAEVFNKHTEALDLQSDFWGYTVDLEWVEQLKVYKILCHSYIDSVRRKMFNV